ncbi:hypothetical protein BS47DRAFT_578357 [Hydnum rufescens UP504]|uniref:Uncharacterized protein n=1 Tax=Hydnum rufescens UP504 TaxID=1448309 RepID=A0A9P6AG39_9AGAM|nr:hypothetical protein BS47DRAFT_578357 [Hydnum rufescens UP504]
MSRSQSNHDFHAQLMWAAQRSDTFFPIESPGSSTPSLTSSSKLSSLRRKLVKRRPSNDSSSLASFHPIPESEVVEVRSRKQSNQPLPQEALDTVIRNVDAILSPTYSLEQRASPAVTRSLPNPEPVVVHKRPSRPSTSPALNNVDRSAGFVLGDASIPHRAIQRVPGARHITEDNILPPDPFARPLPSRSKSYSDMRQASQETRPPMPKLPLTPPGSEISSEVSPTEVTPAIVYDRRGRDHPPLSRTILHPLPAPSRSQRNSLVRRGSQNLRRLLIVC